ncbi:hypothetical protein M2109_005848 [Paenibacillus sp. PastH-3]|nr:hypothetical protein [Paenibacillus sp. PastH-4]MDH6531461.1 hypothetical protein [Paenibacillus sp. PastH-3]
MLSTTIDCHPLPLTDPDDVICKFIAFSAGFRTPETLLLRKRFILGVFRANSGYEVRWNSKCAIMLRYGSTVSDRALCGEL